jgi:hypothetical protein
MSWQAQNFSHGLRTDYRKSLGFCNWIQSFATSSVRSDKSAVGKEDQDIEVVVYILES